MSSELPPTDFFSGINFNPDFYSSGSDNITTEEAKNLIIAYTSSGSDIITTLTTSTINTLGSTLSIGINGTTNDTINIGTNSNTQTNIYGGTIGLLSNTTITGILTSNSYNLSGTTPTLTKESLGYYVNYAKVSASFSVSNRYLYTPSSNTAITDSNYLNAGVYIANIHIYYYAPSSQIYTTVLSVGVATGTTIQTMANNSQYGTLNIESDNFTALNNGANTTGNYSMYSHSGCFTLTTSSFANIQFRQIAQSGASLTFNLYGDIHRIA